jgi:DNA-binding CsgD family transcriptional regulator
VICTLDERLADDVSVMLSIDGWLPLRHPPSREGALRVITEVPATASVDATRSAYICVPTPFACAIAFQALSQQRIGAAVLRDELAKLSLALHALDGDLRGVSSMIGTLALEWPPLEQLEIEVLSRWLGAMGAREIGAEVGMSESTVKRTMSRIRARCGVRSDHELAGMATRLGVEPHGRPRRGS